MNRVERAKQFLPFDALKGLKEELESREEKISRVPRHELTEERAEEISAVIQQLYKGAKIIMMFYRAGHYYELKGTIANVNTIYKYLLIGEEKIFFDDIELLGKYIEIEYQDSSDSENELKEFCSLCGIVGDEQPLYGDIINKRYFLDKTQMEIAEEIGISQAQVSRLEKSALKTIFNDSLLEPRHRVRGLLFKKNDYDAWERPDKPRRYGATRENAILQTADGVQFYVNTQWTKNSVENIIKIAREDGFRILVELNN